MEANKVDTNVNIITEQRLLERDLGKLTGRNLKDAYSTFSETAIKVWSRGYYSTPDEGENLDSVVIRLRGFLNYNIQPLLKKQKNVLLVCHNDVLRAISVIMGKHTKQSIETCEVIDTPFIVRIGKDNAIKIQ